MNIRLIIENKHNCTGCSACANVCPMDAITMMQDSNGFIYPHISDECVMCGKCVDSCPKERNSVLNFPIDTYATYSVDDNLLFHSASGGAFSAIASNFLQNNGVVFGCSLEHDGKQLCPKHIMITSTNEISKLQGSKYVQSSINSTYKKVLELLLSGKKVLFSGTPCQIDGLYGYLGNVRSENLFTIDIICHGVSSADMLQGFVRNYEKINNCKVLNIHFRTKDNGWGLKAKIIYRTDDGINKSRILQPMEFSYYYLFLQGSIYRDNCYNCRYACKERIGDITLGDFWGIENECPELFSDTADGFCMNKGISCMLVNTKKGGKILSCYGSGLHLSKVDYEKIYKNNKQLNEPSKASKEHIKVMQLYNKGGYVAVEKWFRNKVKVHDCISKIIPLNIKELINKLCKGKNNG